MRRRILTKYKKDDGRGIIDGYEYVDLELPSGLLWATCNVGATTETGYGDYYKYGKGSITYDSSDDIYTGKEIPLASSADTATQVMGSPWRMPTRIEMSELVNNTTYSFVTINGVNGGKFTSKSNPNAYVFFPAAGYYDSDYDDDDNPFDEGIGGTCWSSTTRGSNNWSYCESLFVSSENKSVGMEYRGNGLSVRTVRSAYGRGIIDSYEYVDLELPSGLLWATCNVGATAETDYGDYYKWGAITTSGYYDEQSFGTLPLEKDAAHVNMGGDWRMPTKEEFEELVNNTTLTHVTVNGVNCGKFSKTVNGDERFILFPKAGRNGNVNIGTDFDVYSSTAYDNTHAYGMWYNGSSLVIPWYWGNGKTDSLSIRGVHQRS